jgi:quercetin dioxygenase-like cupin family protein
VYEIQDLPELLLDVPPDSIISRTIFKSDKVIAVLFGFAEGTELSEHTAAKPAILQFIAGEAALTLGEDEHSAKPGTWVHMPANLPHSVKAKTAVQMILLLMQ